MRKFLHFKLLLLLIVNSEFALAVECLRFSTEKEIIKVIEVLAPIGSNISEAKSNIGSQCSKAQVRDHFYKESPLIYELQGEQIEVWSWVEVTEGPYRFFNRFLLKTHVVANIYFNQAGEAVAHEATLQTDSL